MNPQTYEPDLLDEMTAVLAQDRPEIAHEWEATKIVAQLRKVREERGLTQAQVASRMGLPQQRVAEIERRPWSASLGRVVAYARAIGSEVGIVGDLPLTA